MDSTLHERMDRMKVDWRFSCYKRWDYYNHTGIETCSPVRGEDANTNGYIDNMYNPTRIVRNERVNGIQFLAVKYKTQTGCVSFIESEMGEDDLRDKERSHPPFEFNDSVACMKWCWLLRHLNESISIAIDELECLKTHWMSYQFNQATLKDIHMFVDEFGMERTPRVFKVLQQFCMSFFPCLWDKYPMVWDVSVGSSGWPVKMSDYRFQGGDGCICIECKKNNNKLVILRNGKRFYS